jgi:hypothetical protein
MMGVRGRYLRISIRSRHPIGYEGQPWNERQQKGKLFQGDEKVQLRIKGKNHTWFGYNCEFIGDRYSQFRAKVEVGVAGIR